MISHISDLTYEGYDFRNAKLSYGPECTFWAKWTYNFDLKILLYTE